MTEKLVPFVLGLVVPLITQTVTGWYLNSGRGIALYVGLLLVAAMLATRWRLGNPWRKANWLALGAMAASTVVLFVIGPGNLFPIVLIFAALLSVASAYAGATLASLRLP